MYCHLEQTSTVCVGRADLITIGFQCSHVSFRKIPHILGRVSMRYQTFMVCMVQCSHTFMVYMVPMFPHSYGAWLQCSHTVMVCRVPMFPHSCGVQGSDVPTQLWCMVTTFPQLWCAGFQYSYTAITAVFPVPWYHSGYRSRINI